MSNFERADALVASAQPRNTQAVLDAYGPGARPSNPLIAEQPDINKAYKLPEIDIVAFGQDTPSDTGGLWNGIKHLFGNHTTSSDLVKQDVESKMSPEELKELRKEESAYQDKMKQWETQANISGANHPPDMNDYPMMVKRELMIRNEEGDIASRVVNQMPPGQMAEVTKEYNEYQKALKDNWFFSPEPGPALKDFYRQIGEATEKTVNGK